MNDNVGKTPQDLAKDYCKIFAADPKSHIRRIYDAIVDTCGTEIIGDDLNRLVWSRSTRISVGIPDTEEQLKKRPYMFHSETCGYATILMVFRGTDFKEHIAVVDARIDYSSPDSPTVSHYSTEGGTYAETLEKPIEMARHAIEAKRNLGLTYVYKLYPETKTEPAENDIINGSKTFKFFKKKFLEDPGANIRRIGLICGVREPVVGKGITGQLTVGICENDEGKAIFTVRWIKDNGEDHKTILQASYGDEWANDDSYLGKLLSFYEIEEGMFAKKRQGAAYKRLSKKLLEEYGITHVRRIFSRRVEDI